MFYNLISHCIKTHTNTHTLELESNCIHIRSDQSLSGVRLPATPWIAARQASPSITNSQSSLRLTSIESVMPSSHLILCRPLLQLAHIQTDFWFLTLEPLFMSQSKENNFSSVIMPSIIIHLPEPLSLLKLAHWHFFRNIIFRVCYKMQVVHSKQY